MFAIEFLAISFMASVYLSTTSPRFRNCLPDEGISLCAVGSFDKFARVNSTSVWNASPILTYFLHGYDPEFESQMHELSSLAFVSPRTILCCTSDSFRCMLRSFSHLGKLLIIDTSIDIERFFTHQLTSGGLRLHARLESCTRSWIAIESSISALVFNLTAAFNPSHRTVNGNERQSGHLLMPRSCASELHFRKSHINFG